MIGILWGALAAHLLTVTLGLLLLFPFRLRLSVWERWAAAAACGLPAAVAFVQGLAATGLFRRGIVQASVAVCVIASVWLYRRTPNESAAVSNRVWLAILPIWAWVAFAAAGPDLTPPGEDQPLVAAHRFVSRFDAAPWDIGAAYAVPYLLGRHSAVALFHATLLLPAAAALGRFGWLAMILFAAHPGLMTLASRGGSAAAFCLASFTAAATLVLALYRREPRLAIVAGLAAIAAVFAWPAPLDVFSGFVFIKTPWWLAPFLAAALGWLAAPVRPAAIALAAFAVLTAWPPVTTAVAPPRPPGKDLSGMVEARFLDILPPASVVLSDIPMPAAWVPRRLAPHPEWLDEARRVAAAQWGLRTIPFSSSGLIEVNPPGFIGEALVSVDGRLLDRQPGWRVWPPEAFDGLPFTGSTGPIRLDLGKGPHSGDLRIIGTEGEAWTPPGGLRRNVVLDWQRRGVTHVLVRDPQLIEEFAFQGTFWGVDPLGERNNARLYALR